MPLSIQGTEQQFNALVELRDGSGTVQFSSTQLVTAREASRPAAPSVAITLQYVGPGATAKTITVSPSETILLPGASQPLVATAIDQSGAPVANLIVSWTSSDTTIARVTPTGNVSATATSRGARGTVTFTARTPNGVAGSAKVTVLPQAARLVVISGNGQTGVALATLGTPFTVEVQATDGGKVPGALVTFRAVTAGGEVSAGAVSTDASGRATTGVSVTATMVVTPGGAATSVTAQSDALGVLVFSLPAFKTAGSVLITLTSPVMQNLPFGTFPIVP